MSTGSASLLFLALFLVACLHAEVVQWRPCTYPDPNTPLNCTIHEVRVDPCKEAPEGKPCRIRRGHDANISFDYTAEFEGDKLEGRAYWANQVVDLPFLGMETDACVATPCPATPGKKQTYEFRLPLAKKLPVRTYDVKWKLWNDKEQECCLIVQVKLTK
ncbi:MD-2-related lipid-recognition protein [Orussus abietinus]|uniref:MD-2-related lipid-recognition protein n=1 Tax=Orussus abietinus TaxID=222816 RepID=UPI000626D1EE|nr:MD-2-related lipid-recognition protein [Orussus abietinus]